MRLLCTPSVMPLVTKLFVNLLLPYMQMVRHFHICLFVYLFLILLEAPSLYLLQRKTGDLLQLFKCKSEVHSKRVNVT